MPLYTVEDQRLTRPTNRQGLTNKLTKVVDARSKQHLGWWFKHRAKKTGEQQKSKAPWRPPGLHF